MKKNKEKAYINNDDEATLEYYQVFEKQIKPLPSGPKLSDFYHPSEAQRNSEISLSVVDTGIATYALCKYLK